MDLDTARKIVERISETPASSVSIEFQGGEPLTNLPVIKEVVAYAKACLKNKIVEYSLVSNLSLVNDEIADFIADNGINVSASLDGPQPLMNSSFYLLQCLRDYGFSYQLLDQRRAALFLPLSTETLLLSLLL